MRTTQNEDRKPEVLEALEAIARLGAARAVLSMAGDSLYAVELNWGAVLVSASMNSESDGDATAQDKLIQAIASVLGTSDEELLTIPQLASRLAAPVIPRLPQNTDLVELAGTVAEMRRVAKDSLPEIAGELALLSKLVFIHAAARAYLVEAGRLKDEGSSGGVRKAEEKAQELILGDDLGDGPSVLLLEPDACQLILDFVNGDSGGEVMEPLLPGLQAIAGMAND